ncbi:MAG: PAS domain-containing sensor histidine kinase [Chloroflexota bacterium]
MLTQDQSEENFVQELREAEMRFTHLFEGSGDSIVIVDAETSQILRANANMRRRLGYSKKELLSMTFDDIEVIPESGDNLSWISTHSATQVYECEVRHKDGSLIPVEISSRLSQYNHRTVYQNAIRDISVRKQAEQERLEMIIERERTEILTKFVTQTSHEFRTPLSIIRTNTYLLNRLYNSMGQQDYTAKIEDQVSNITTLVDVLLTTVKLDRLSTLSTENVDLCLIISGVIQRWRVKPISFQCLFHVEFSNQPIWINANVEFLIQAFDALIENAVDAIEESGKIDVLIECLDDTNVSIEIRDTGVGIDESHLSQIFEHFYRVDKSGTKRGFGLGLPIANRIIELHQGRIEVSSLIGHGSTFKVILPISRDPNDINLKH